jgi:hypothetical protein
MYGRVPRVAGGLQGALQSTGLPLPGAPGCAARPPFGLAQRELNAGSLSTLVRE